MSDRPRRGLFDLPKSVQVKAGLRADVDASVQRCQQALPVLGQRFPDAVFVVERNIFDFLPSSSDGVDPDQIAQPTVYLVVDKFQRTRSLQRLNGLYDPQPPRRLTGPDDPRLDDAEITDGPPAWWYSDPEWVERELTLVNVALAIKQFQQRGALQRVYIHTSRPRPHRRHA